MAILHLLSHSPFSDSRLDSCLRLLGTSDALLLCGDALYALQAGSAPWHRLATLPESVSLYALEDDLLARGLELPARVQAVDYSAFVELCCRYHSVNGWT